MMSAFEKIGTRFPFEFYKNVMISLSKQNNTHHFKELQLEFETWGHQYDGELYSAILRMYSRVKDYRKVKNTWEYVKDLFCFIFKNINLKVKWLWQDVGQTVIVTQSCWTLTKK